jgi:hypothetical protein
MSPAYVSIPVREPEQKERNGGDATAILSHLGYQFGYWLKHKRRYLKQGRAEMADWCEARSNECFNALRMFSHLLDCQMGQHIARGLQ